jgi:hypothetical protein
MDPNANVKEQLIIAQRLLDYQDGKLDNDYGDVDASIDGARLAELVLALDGWINNGGFLPQNWQ